MLEKKLKKIKQIITEQEKVEKPTYLGYFHAYNSLVLNRKNEHFFIKNYKHINEGDWHTYLMKNFFLNDEIHHLWYLYHLMEGGNKDNYQPPLPLTKDERMRLIFATTKFWQDELPKHEEKLGNIGNLKGIKDLDLFKTLEKLFESNTPKELEIKKKLEELGNILHQDISDEELLKEFFYTEEVFNRPFNKIAGFYKAADNLTELISELFQKNIFMGYKKAFLKLPLAEVIKHFPKILISIYIFKLQIDSNDAYYKAHYKRLKGLKKSLTVLIDKMIKTFSHSDAEDVGWIDMALIIGPAVTFKNNLDIWLKFYKKIFKEPITKTGRIGRFYEKLFIKSLYTDIKEECKTSDINKKPIEILLEVLGALSDVLINYNKIYTTNLGHLSYDYDNILKIIHSNLTNTNH